jgi:DNA-binding NtrC family response regulator
MEVITEAIERYPEITAIVITAFGTVETAVDALKLGAADYVSKPFRFDALLHSLSTALERKRLRSENAYLKAQLQERYRFNNLIGASRPMRDLFELLATVAPTNTTVLITGETGTGKELVARAIHHGSSRRTHRFVALSCSAIPESLLEAELFGHVRGAFTGAVDSRPGRLEQAHKGTLFLDEVGTMSPGLQAKLLRVIQEREFERLGGTKTIGIDVRILAATNSDLVTLIAEGKFREDLYYRLNVIPVHLPPLRERQEDIPLLAQHLLQRLGREVTPPRQSMVLSQDVVRQLMTYPWPGNIRELENVMERALTFSQGRSQIELVHLPSHLQVVSNSVTAHWPSTLPDQGLSLETHIKDIERQFIKLSLDKAKGNKRRAADLLGLKRTTLVEKMKRLGV